MNHRVARLLVVAALLAGIGSLCTVQANNAGRSESARNLAHVEVESTLEARSAVNRAVNAVLTYTFHDVEATEQAAENLLGGRARQEYRRLFGQVGERAPTQRLTVTTRVVDSAVLSLTADRARVLVFADQTAARGDEDPTHSATQLLITAERHDDRWLVTELEPA